MKCTIYRAKNIIEYVWYNITHLNLMLNTLKTPSHLRNKLENMRYTIFRKKKGIGKIRYLL